MPNMRRYDWENPQPAPADEDDESGVYFESDTFDDEYDRYEDAYLDTGYDPYHLFTDEIPPTALYFLKNRCKRLVARLWHGFLMHVSADYRAKMNEIPF